VYILETDIPLTGLDNYIFESISSYTENTRWKLEAIDLNGNRWEYGPVSVPRTNQIQIMMNISQSTNGFKTQVSFLLDVAGEVIFSVYNLRGEKVTEKFIYGLPGINTVSWDAQNDFSQPVSAGIYLAKVAVGNYSESCKITITK
jgi:hypothetical protein